MRTPVALAALSAMTAMIMSASAAEPPLAALAGSEWGFPDAGDAYIQFADTTVSGTSGCNRFSGSYTFSGGALAIGPLAATRMACAPDKMEAERRIFALLEMAKAADATHKTLVLKDGTGAVLATLNRRDWD